MQGLVFFILLTAEIEESILFEAEKKKFLEKVSSNCIVLCWRVRKDTVLFLLILLCSKILFVLFQI